MKILISKGNIKNAKSYPDEYWDELIDLLKDHEIKEIKGILPLNEIVDLVNWADTILSIDSFLPHLIVYHKIDKKVIVLWGTSDPLIFGYPENINLLKDRSNLREQQFKWWKDEPVPSNDVWVTPEDVFLVV